MRTATWVSILLVGCPSIGCSSSGTAAAKRASAVTGPHGGSTVTLPNGMGFGEVVMEIEAGSGSAADRVRVVAYFLKPDLKTALTPPPSDVQVKLEFPDKPSELLALTLATKSDDPAGSARFASKPGSYLVDEPVGELTASLAGQSFTLHFAGMH